MMPQLQRNNKKLSTAIVLGTARQKQRSFVSATSNNSVGAVPCPTALSNTVELDCSNHSRSWGDGKQHMTCRATTVLDGSNNWAKGEVGYTCHTQINSPPEPHQFPSREAGLLYRCGSSIWPPSHRSLQASFNINKVT